MPKRNERPLKFWTSKWMTTFEFSLHVVSKPGQAPGFFLPDINFFREEELLAVNPGNHAISQGLMRLHFYVSQEKPHEELAFSDLFNSGRHFLRRTETMENVNKIIRLPAVLDMIGMSKPSVYNMIKRGDFPAPIKLGPKASGWLVNEVQGWIAERMSARAVK